MPAAAAEVAQQPPALAEQAEAEMVQQPRPALLEVLVPPIQVAVVAAAEATPPQTETAARVAPAS